MPNRGAGGVSYRYGFNGKETENDVKGVGNEQDYGMRIYDPRLGRFLSVDPIASSYPWYTPFQFAGNTPIWSVDVDGLEPEQTSDPSAVHHLNNAELRDAIKIAHNQIVSDIKSKNLKVENLNAIKGKLMEAAAEYVVNHQLSNQKTADFFNAVFKYHQGIWGIANWNLVSVNLITQTLNANDISDVRKIGVVNYGIRLYERKSNLLIDMSKDAVFLVAGASLFPNAGNKMRSKIGSFETQEKIVNASLRETVPKIINKGQQGKHIIGHNNYQTGKSILTEDGQTLLNEFHDGKATILRQVNSHKIAVDFGRPIGQYIDPSTQSAATTSRGMINFGKNGAHIVPSKPG